MSTPASLFSHGYALLIGVDDQADASLKRYALPGVKNDIERLSDVLTHPERCGYPPEQVSILLGADATKNNIRKAIKTLGEQVAEGDPGNATVVIYFSGHGLSTAFAGEQRFYLAPYDVETTDPDAVDATAVKDEIFSYYVGQIEAARVLILLDCCHAGATEAKTLEVPIKITSSAEEMLRSTGARSIQGSQPDGDEEPDGEPDGDVPDEDQDGEDTEKITPPPKEEPKPIGSKPLPVGPPADDEGADEDAPEENEDDGDQEKITPPQEEKPKPIGSKPLPVGDDNDPKAVYLGSRFEQLNWGTGRAILLSSRDVELSFMNQEGSMSLFTEQLINALSGHARHAEDATTVGIFDAINHVAQQVPAQAEKLGHPQHPQVRFDGENYPLALLFGGKGLPKGQPAPELEDTLQLLDDQPAPRPMQISNTANVMGDQNMVFQGNENNQISINQGS